jgi:predicted phage terminase large subunit-like protein
MLLAHDGGEKWELLSMPALDENDAALWPERFSAEELKSIRDQIPLRDWLSLYQQTPTSETGTFFLRSWFEDHRYDTPPENLSIYCSTDFAVTKSGGDLTELCIFGEDKAGDVFVLEWHYAQTTLDKSIDTLLDMCKRHRPRTIFGESGVIKSSLEPFLQKRMREEGQWTQCEWITRRSDKQASAQPIRARASMGKVRFPKKPWADRVINQCVAFPAGKYDDAVDTLALIGMALDKTHAPASVYRRPPPRRGTTWMSR